jgi:cyanate lyase
MQPMSNAEYLTRLKYADELDFLKDARKKAGLTYTDMAAKLGVSKVWLASVFDGQQYVPEEYCKKLAELLGVPLEKTLFLTEHPYKGCTDPILYRLHEVIDTYGPAIKAIIHEQGGNAIMSAIDFGIDCNVITDDAGNHRVIITWDGKLLPYAERGKYPW